MDCHDCSSSTEAARNNERAYYVKVAQRLALASIGWNLFEGLAALVLAHEAGSIALMGFGMDSMIETASAVIVGWRFWSESKSQENSDELERRTAKTVAILLLLLSGYIVFDAVRKLCGIEQPAKKSGLGILLTLCALVVMPVLARAKYKAALALESSAMKAEAFQSLTCAWLAGATLLGLALNTVFHLSWADPVAALILVPAIVKEALEAFRGKLCTDCH